jgi:hypothetical protein
MLYHKAEYCVSKKHIFMLVRYLGHLGSATLAAGLIGVILSATLSGMFKERLFFTMLLAGAIMGYLVNRKMRDLSARLVWIIPLCMVALRNSRRYRVFFSSLGKRVSVCIHLGQLFWDALQRNGMLE